ncbi:hypothetical protein FACS189449_07100 [Alphaproteobacteria bacterium]|nr:hypothetical protein FACS189449_07100 [Alphaproteobacteria bacterium]
MLNDQLIDSDDSKKIESTVASFRTLQSGMPIKNAVVYLWESHTEDPDGNKKIQATNDLILKRFDLSTCEKYEVRTGYLSRHNYLQKPMNESTTAEIEEAIAKGEEEEKKWVNRCSPDLCGFIPKKWQECISEKENFYFEECKNLVMKLSISNEVFSDAFLKSVNDYAIKHGTNKTNGELYVLEETTWVLSLMLLHPNKPIYLIHIGNYNPAIKELVRCFPSLQNAVKLLSPRFRNLEFSNTADFLINYRDNDYSGFSYATENNKVVKAITTFKKEQELDYSTLNFLKREYTNFDIMHSVIEKLPGHVYWLSRDNVYLGCNKLQAKDFGLKSQEDVIGKTNYDFHSLEDAKELDRVNNQVMETGEEYEGEEPSSIQCEYKKYLSHKTPLFDLHGKIIGLLGVSIDITDRKRAQKLELENTRQQAKIEEQEKFKIFVQQISHDIRSPLVTLSMLLSACKNLPENEYVALRNVITSIESISNNLLNTYKKNGELSNHGIEYILLPFSLSEIINEKKCQYQSANIKFNFSNNSSHALFIKGDFLNYARMISNLLNNAAESIEGRDGLVEVNFVEKDQQVEIHIKDNGKGMPKEMVNKILNDVSIGTTKTSGHGLGMQQIKDTLQKMNGKMLITSTENLGTEFTLIFQKSEYPKWFAEKIVLPKGGTVVVLDDDPSIHSVWENHLEDYLNGITVKYFTQGLEAIHFINSSKEKNKILLLTDYELRNQKVNGMDVIEKTNMQNKSILVTSVYMFKIENFSKKCDVIKTLAKALILDTPVIVDVERKTENVSIVIIDNDKSMESTLPTFFKDNGLSVDMYANPRDFLDNLPRYSKDTIIVTDHDLGCDINGFDVAKKAYKLGYAKLYMMSGDMFDKSDVPSYLTLLFKNIDSFEKLLHIANSARRRPT